MTTVIFQDYVTGETLLRCEYTSAPLFTEGTRVSLENTDGEYRVWGISYRVVRSENVGRYKTNMVIHLTEIPPLHV